MRISDWSSAVCSSDLRDPVTRTHDHYRHLRGYGQGLADVLRLVTRCSLEVVDRHDVRQAAALEVVERREAVLQTPGVGEDDRADRPAHQVVPHQIGSES